MSSEINRIKEKVEYSQSRFVAYLNNLIGPGRQHATNLEKDLFNLQAGYADGVLRRDEVQHLKESFMNLDFEQLVEDRKIIYRNSTNRLEYRINTYDFNKDGKVDQKDKDAVEHVINYFENNVNTLNEMLAMAGNKDAIAKFHIESWAKERGMQEGSDKFDEFVGTFYNQYYANPEVRASMEILSQLVKLYDIGLGNEDITELDSYLLLLRENQPLRLLAQVYRFTESDSFDIPDDQKQEAKDGLFAALINKNVPERQKLIADSIISRKIAILGDPLTATGLIDFVARTGSESAIAEMRIEDLAKRLGLQNLQSNDNDEFDVFVNKFFTQYFKNPETGLNITGLTNLARVYSRLKTIRGEEFHIDDLDIYAYALENTGGTGRVYYGDLNSLMNLERRAEDFGLTNANREETLKKYIDIITGADASDKKLKGHVKHALRTGRLPITGTPMTIDSLNDFLSKASDESEFLKIVITKIANDKGIFDNPASTVDEFDRFLSNFTDYAEGFPEAQKAVELSFLAQLYDGVEIDFDQLDLLARARKNKASRNDLAALARLYKSDTFNIVDKAEKLREYSELISGPDRNKKQVIAALARSGTLLYSPLEKNEVRIRDVDAILAKLDEENGVVELRMQSLARNIEIDEYGRPTEFNNFVSTMMDYSINKNFDQQSLAMLANIYKESPRGFTDVQPYVTALEDNVPTKNVATIFKFTQSEEFDLIGSGKDRALEKYFGILSKPPETDADKERKNILINSIRSKRVYLTGEDLTTTRLDDILDRTQTDDQIFDLQSDKWAESLEYTPNSSKYRDFKATVYDLRMNQRLSSTSIVRSMGFLKNYPEMNFSDFSNIADLLSRKRKSTPKVRQVMSFIHSPEFSTTTTSSDFKSRKLEEYLAILESGSTLEKEVLNRAMRSFGSRALPEEKTIQITGKVLNAINLKEALDLAQDEDGYRETEIKNLAKGLGYKVGTTDYISFNRLFYQSLYKDQKMSINDIRYLAGFYSRGVFSDPAFNEVIEAQRQRVKPKILFNFEKFVNLSSMPSDEQVAYLRVLRGVEGSVKQQFLSQVFGSNFIPIANSRLF